MEYEYPWLQIAPSIHHWIVQPVATHLFFFPGNHWLCVPNLPENFPVPPFSPEKFAQRIDRRLLSGLWTRNGNSEDDLPLETKSTVFFAWSFQRKNISEKPKESLLGRHIPPDITRYIQINPYIKQTFMTIASIDPSIFCWHACVTCDRRRPLELPADDRMGSFTIKKSEGFSRRNWGYNRIWSILSMDMWIG